MKPDSVENSDVEIPEFNVSYKPQKISPKFQSTVRHLLHSRIRDSYTHPQFMSDVMKPLLIEQLMDQEVVNLSGGELQRVALCICLGKVNFVYLLLCRTFCVLGCIHLNTLWYSFYLLPGLHLSGWNCLEVGNGSKVLFFEIQTIPPTPWSQF